MRKNWKRPLNIGASHRVLHASDKSQFSILSHLHHDDRRWYRATRVEREFDVLVRRDLLCESSRHHLGQGLLLGLSLTGELGGTVTEPGDVVLEGEARDS